MNSKLCFVVGCWRSGTTWLNRSLASHPEVLGIPETHIFGHSGAPNRASAAQVSQAHFWNILDNERLLQNPSDSPPLPRVDPRPRDMERKLLRTLGPDRRSELLQLRNRMPQTSSWQEVATEMFSILDGLRPVVVEKTPSHVHCLPRMLEQFPDSAVVGLIRDPRDVLCSIRALDKPWARRVRDEDHVANYWATCLLRLFEAQKQWPGQIKSVRYEDLSADFDRTMSAVLHHLDLPTASLNTIREANTFHAYTGRAAGEEAQGWFYRKGVAGAFKTELDHHQIESLERRLKPLLKRMRYPLVQLSEGVA